ncbi:MULTISPECIES: hypothetical protein [Sorangium]|uniref:Uncharacterized protein n=1 Tax=Sorangium cellulosum TaxID=56 RepID=A0A4P2QXH1_SORCE|nr:MULTISPECIES: hypothetical protein [Sorangium]AUX35247.1 uncharacterized protein SOCE836_074370 [Sorangium cellulosum]WCQ94552.1 hypothetical protein NQZ70_07320 [Sorangium sp. Soce836]
MKFSHCSILAVVVSLCGCIVDPAADDGAVGEAAQALIPAVDISHRAGSDFVPASPEGGHCEGARSMDALARGGSDAELATSSLAACTDGFSTCSGNRCFACCNGVWHDINACLWGVNFYCNGIHYNAYSCWPNSFAQDAAEE